MNCGLWLSFWGTCRSALSGLLKGSPKHAREWACCTMTRVLEPSHTISFLKQYWASDIGWVRKHNWGGGGEGVFLKQFFKIKNIVWEAPSFTKTPLTDSTQVWGRGKRFSHNELASSSYWSMGTMELLCGPFSCLAGRKFCFPSIIGTFLRHDLVLFSITSPFPSSTTCFALMLIFKKKKSYHTCV